MRAWAKQFALVFFAGFVVLGIALGYGSIRGELLSEHPFLVALRFLGAGFMVAGLALWIALRRNEGGKSGLNSFFGLTLVGGCVLLILGAIFPADDLGPLFGWGGLGFNLAALLVGIIAMLLTPVSSEPVTVRWPGNEVAETKPHDVSHGDDKQVAEPQE